MAKPRMTRVNRGLKGDIGLFLFLALFGIFMALPLVYSVVQSIKPMEEIFIFPPRFFVHNPTMDNFIELFRLAGNSWVIFDRYLFNSLFVSAVSTVFHVLISSMAAFPLAKYRFPGSVAFFNIVVVSLLFTTTVTALPSYLVMSKLGLIDTYGAYILPAIGGSLGLFLMKQFMSDIPDTMIEAAMIDGASCFKTLWRIIMPNVKPAWLTCIIFAFNSIWNYEGTSLIYSEQLKVLPTMFKQISEGGIARVGVSAASAVLLMIVPIVIFVVSQSNVLETMAHSGMKD